MTEKDTEMIELIRSYPDTEYALQKAIEIFTFCAERPSASQAPYPACLREAP